MKKKKSKELALALAILLGIPAWIYTWKEDYWKFLIGFFLNMIGLSLINFLSWAFLIPVGVWLWVITDVIKKEY